MSERLARAARTAVDALRATLDPPAEVWVFGNAATLRLLKAGGLSANMATDPQLADGVWFVAAQPPLPIPTIHDQLSLLTEC